MLTVTVNVTVTVIMQGMSGSEVKARFLEFGENVIKISVPKVSHLVIHEGLNPFFLFQAYTVG